jgi:hypothetical protein
VRFALSPPAMLLRARRAARRRRSPPSLAIVEVCLAHFGPLCISATFILDNASEYHDNNTGTGGFVRPRSCARIVAAHCRWPSSIVRPRQSPGAPFRSPSYLGPTDKGNACQHRNRDAVVSFSA